MSEASPSPTNIPSGPEGYSPAEAIGRTVSRVSVAYHGLGSRLHERRIRRSEERADRLEHEAAFFEALGNIATEVSGEGDNLPPVKFDSLDRTASVDSAGRPKLETRREDFPDPATGPLPVQKSPLRLQARSFRLAPVFKQEGTMNPAQETSQTEFDRQHIIDPRSPDPNNPEILSPMTKRERSAEKHLAKRVERIREMRKAQTTRRRMTGHTGPHAFWRTKLRHGRERLADRNEDISPFEARRRAKERRTDMTTVVPHRLRETAQALDNTTEQLVGTMEVTAERIGKKQEKVIDKIPELETKVDSHTTKQQEQKDRVVELEQRRAERKINNKQRRRERREKIALASKQALARAKDKVSSAKQKIDPRNKS